MSCRRSLVVVVTKHHCLVQVEVGANLVEGQLAQAQRLGRGDVVRVGAKVALVVPLVSALLPRGIPSTVAAASVLARTRARSMVPSSPAFRSNFN